ncbi:MAG: hypothetical protein LUE19_00900 [Clostridiales bacterium]|nr:hypothetical protein [Clostridiales bacterium]
MLKKLSSLITNNFGLKILGIIFAVILWMAIVNIQDPDKTLTFSLEVEVVHEDFLTELGKTYEVLNGTDTISFTVTGKRSVVENLTAADFKAVANIEDIDDSMSIVPITVTATSYSSQLEITMRSSYMQVNVENLVTQEYEIEVLTNGMPATSCFVDSLSTSPGTVTVTGPESVVGQIDSAQVTLDISGASDEVSSEEDILLLDESGDEIAQDRLTLSATRTTAMAGILMRKSVSLSFDVTGEPADGTRYHEIQSEISSVMLVGDADLLRALSSLEISSDQLNIDGVSESVTVEIHLSDYLPDGVSLADNESEDITVTIEIEAQITTDVEMPVSNITVSNLADGLELSFDSDTVTVTLTGYEDELSSVSGDSVTGVLDASGLTEGARSVTVTLSGDYLSESETTVSVVITDTESSDTADFGTTNSGTTNSGTADSGTAAGSSEEE